MAKKKKVNVAELNALVHERDNDCCVYCGIWVDPGEKFHHEPPKSQGGQDKEEHAVTLCYDCHWERHNGKNSIDVKEKARNYLRSMYEK